LAGTTAALVRCDAAPSKRPSLTLLNKSFDPDPRNPLIADFRIFLDPGFLIALFLGLLLLACVGGVILYADIQYGISPFH